MRVWFERRREVGLLHGAHQLLMWAGGHGKERLEVGGPS